MFDEQIEEIDKIRLVHFLAQLEMGALNAASEAKASKCVQHYAKAAAFKYIMDAIIQGNFDVDVEDTRTLN
jgi:hypothetical protein